MFMFSIFNISLNAQTSRPFVISTGGEYFKDTQYSVSYTIGEIFTPTISAGNTIITQGFQQPFNSYAITVPESYNMLNSVNIFPNPFTNELNIRIQGSQDLEELEVFIFDISGRLVENPRRINASYQNDVFIINAENLVSGVYIIKILDVRKGVFADFKLTKL